MRPAAIIVALLTVLTPGVLLAAPVCPSLTRLLTRGSTDVHTSGEVTRLQTFLASYYELDAASSVTGFFGARTAATVIRFQRENNVPAQGVVGPRTREAIRVACGGGESAQRAEPRPYTLSSRPVGTNTSHLEFTFTPDTPDYTPGSTIYDIHYPEYAIDFGDGFKKLWSRSCTESGVCVGSATHTYKKPGTYTAVLLYSPAAAQTACDTVSCRLQTFTRAAATLDVRVGAARSSLSQPAPSVGIWFTETIARGGTAAIKWESANVNRCVFQYDGIEETVPVKGEKSFILSTTTAYSLWCANDVGTESDGKDVLKTFTVRVI